MDCKKLRISCAKARTHHSIVGIGQFFFYSVFIICRQLMDCNSMFTFRYISIVFCVCVFYCISCFCIHNRISEHQLRTAYDRYDSVFNPHNNKFYIWIFLWLNSRTATLKYSFFFFFDFNFYSLENFLKKKELLTRRNGNRQKWIAFAHTIYL